MQLSRNNKCLKAKNSTLKDKKKTWHCLTRDVWFRADVVVIDSSLYCCRINAVSNGQVRGDTYGEGCLGRTGEFPSWSIMPRQTCFQSSFICVVLNYFKKTPQSACTNRKRK